MRSLRPLGAGKNNSLWLAEANDGQLLVIKRYFSHSTETHDRGGVEFRASKFLWSRGIRSIPEPLEFLPETPCAVFRFVEGERPSASVTAVDAALHFAAELYRVSKLPEARELPLAWESARSVEEHLTLVKERFRALQEAASPLPEVKPDFCRFMDEELQPKFEQVTNLLPSFALARGVDITEVLSLDRLTLSPADFGFHNALWTGRQFVFLDFDYFGWDNPAKLICDFTLHPGCSLTEDLEGHFLAGATATYPGIAERFAVTFPLCVFKWSVTLLNEFMPVALARRRFAQRISDGEIASLQSKQLEKAKRMLARLGTLPGNITQPLTD